MQTSFTRRLQAQERIVFIAGGLGDRVGRMKRVGGDGRRDRVDRGANESDSRLVDA